MDSFGQSLSYHRRQCQDPQRGGPLTQERLGELIGLELGDAGYSGAAISYWERDISKINKDDRLVLIALITVLRKCGGLMSATQANTMLNAGNYRSLNRIEMADVFDIIDELHDDGLESGSSMFSFQEALNRESDIADGLSDVAFSKRRQKQLLVAGKVHRFWVEGVFQRSFQRSSPITLIVEERRDLVVDPWADLMASSLYKRNYPPDALRILDRFHASNQSLLIVGEPGSGKTMTLIALANELIIQALDDPIRPTPVIFNLGSWADLRRSLDDWLIREMSSKYQVPHAIGRKWLEEDELIVLLDGFDEVPERFRLDCVRAINIFREKRGLTGIVVCSRLQEYEEVGMQLILGGAIAIKSLNDEQIIAYLRQKGGQLKKLQNSLKSDTALQTLARTPLMLSVMVDAYGNILEELQSKIDDDRIAPGDKRKFWQDHLFNAYVKRMFQSRGTNDFYTLEQTELWLGWLAGHMFQSNQPQFLIEQLQPSWLSEKRWRLYYMVGVGILSGITGGILMLLLLQLIRLTDPNIIAPLSGQMARILSFGQRPAEVLTIFLANIFLGLVVGLLQRRYFEKLRDLGKESQSRGWIYQRHLAIATGTIGLLTIGIISISSLPSLAIIWGLAETVMFFTIARYVYGRSFRHEIRTVEALSWSWSGAFKGLTSGIVLAILAELADRILYKEPVHIRSESILIVGGLVLGGLRGKRVHDKSKSNQGIYLSLRNSLWAGIVTSIAVGGLAWYLRSPRYAIIAAAITFIIAGSLFGSGNVMKHFLLRSLLWLHGDIPWRISRFLDYGASLVFLRKVGGSYIFSHRLLQQHFADLYDPSSKPDRLKLVDTSGITRNLERYLGR